MLFSLLFLFMFFIFMWAILTRKQYEGLLLLVQYKYKSVILPTVRHGYYTS